MIDLIETPWYEEVAPEVLVKNLEEIIKAECKGFFVGAAFATGIYVGAKVVNAIGKKIDGKDRDKK